MPLDPLITELALIFDTQERAYQLLEAIEFPRITVRPWGEIPSFDYWWNVIEELHVKPDGVADLLRAAATQYPGNKVFSSDAHTLTSTPAPPSSEGLAPCVAVVGPAGSGKTTLLHHLDHALARHPSRPRTHVVKGNPDGTGRYLFHAPQCVFRRTRPPIPTQSVQC